MPTPAQEAFAEGLGELQSVHGSSWTFGKVSFAGVGTTLRPDDPRLDGASDRLLEIVAVTAQLPSVRPKRGDQLMRGGVYYRITRIDHSPDTGLSTILVSTP